MFHLFDTIGSTIRSFFAVGFAAFWGWSSVLLNGAKLGDLRLIGMVGTVVMVGLAGAAIFAGFFALIMFLRNGDKKPKPEAKKAVAVIDQPSDFDPDAIIARHIQQRQDRMGQIMRQRQSVRAPQFQPARHRPLGAASSFGRKLA
jgi:hypothetical protein